MTSRLLITGSLAALLFTSMAANAEEGFKYRKLKPADPPCLFLLDENTGNPTGDPVNPPCVLGNSTVNPGDNVSAGDRLRYGKAATKDAASGMATGKRQHAPRDAASGMPSGKRQHKPITVTKPIDKSSPRAAGKDTTEMREKARTKDSIEPPKPPGGD
jgi:hypothetical protein